MTVSTPVRTSVVICLECGFGLRPHHPGLARLQRLGSTASLLNATVGPVFVYAAAAAQIFGGPAIQFRRTAKPACRPRPVYLVFALLYVPRIVATPRFTTAGATSSSVSLVTGAAIVLCAPVIGIGIAPERFIGSADSVGPLVLLPFPRKTGILSRQYCYLVPSGCRQARRSGP